MSNTHRSSVTDEYSNKEILVIMSKFYSFEKKVTRATRLSEKTKAEIRAWYSNLESQDSTYLALVDEKIYARITAMRDWSES